MPPTFPTTADPDGRKTAGSRTRDAAATLELLLPCASGMGITRLAMLTGLDRLGIPVAAAIRPNARSVAVHQGKAVTVAGAKVAAMMEAAECWHAETIDAPLRLARAAELDRAVDPLLLPRAPGAPDPTDRRLLWIAGEDLLQGGRHWVPYELVHADYTAAQPGEMLFQATTNGLGAGNHRLEAQLHGLCELVERDALARWYGRGGPRSGSPRLDLASVDDIEIRAILERFAAGPIGLTVWDATGDVGLPVYLALALADTEDMLDAEPEIGAGCGLDPAWALSRALLEAAQERLARISGARDDFDPASFDAAARAERLDAARRWEAAGSRAPAIGWRERPMPDRPTLRHDRDVLLAALDRIGCGQAVWVDLEKPWPGIPVGRAIVPKLEGVWLPGGYRAGTRALRP